MRFSRNGRTQTLRVIDGQYRSRPLRSLPGWDIRPTADRLRETLFNVLNARNPDALAGSTWADLYAGTGAVGIEALSRGAGRVFFVESSRAAAKLIQENLDSGRILRRWQAQGVILDYVFLDPPYRLESAYQETLEFLSESTLLTATSVVIAEHAKQFESVDGIGILKRYRKLVQGEAALSFYRKHPDTQDL